MIAESTYDRLVSELKRIDCLGSTLGLLHWDEQVNLPPASADRRAQVMAALSDITHRESTQPQIGEWLTELEDQADQLNNEQKTVVREARRSYDRNTKLPAEFVARKAALDSQAYHAWAEARKKSDYTVFAPFLEKQLDAAKEAAAYLGFEGEAAYDYHIDLHDPGLSAKDIRQLFTRLKEDLIPLVRKILDSPIQANTEIFKGFPVEAQEAFLRKVTAKIGFDYKRGRIDRSLHPFCSGNGADTRMTTRFFEDNPLDSLFSSIHETGHGLYEQGLPLEHLGTGLGRAVGMAVHESQSRLWENQVGRSRAFWDYWEPKLREKFPKQLESISSDQLYLAINAVGLNPIRVDSDEVTYNLHIILRFELEQRLFSGDLKAKDLPDAWNAASEEIVGLRPENDAMGCLQDIHWSGGAFGYFPSYCLGNMLAAQLWYTAQEALPGLAENFRNGDFHRLLDWLRENIHRRGRQLNTLEITREVTGQDLAPDSLIRYLKERYLPLYT